MFQPRKKAGLSGSEPRVEIFPWALILSSLEEKPDPPKDLSLQLYTNSSQTRSRTLRKELGDWNTFIGCEKNSKISNYLRTN